ncbi:hypothetical protein SAMD00019534_066070 [Acytostelium subglobosum LB1]|uniref:hypothetical protein n=1 Tax=Acytostelium subglobosum LB1 TaxID=1410327 RepID=UPI000644E281|nr:hypothetical protein SAMD00019534_066070 [Acytostelium subglobosum LB1]GAM23432.1 hypothetical protein SAMD00019534_066070 [Acytostelium subglobosum LB1]|eukprot:XP_012753881.1 hypothetical protein SAMD00019534_066070 [Acytostelium subglobosum LB1]
MLSQQTLDNDDEDQHDDGNEVEDLKANHNHNLYAYDDDNDDDGPSQTILHTPQQHQQQDDTSRLHLLSPESQQDSLLLGPNKHLKQHQTPPLSPPMHSHRIVLPTAQQEMRELLSPPPKKSSKLVSSSGSSSSPNVAASGDDNDELMGIFSMQGYTFSLQREILYWLLVVMSCGVIFLAFHWFTLLEINLRRRRTPTLRNASTVLVYGLDMRFEICPVHVGNISDSRMDRFIVFRFSKYFYKADLDSFERPRIKSKYKSSDLYKFIDHGMTRERHDSMLLKFGRNVIEFPIRSIPRLLLEEVLHPFFIFQIYSVILWMCEEYYYYAVAIFIIATISSVLSLKEIRTNLLSLKHMSTYSCQVQVLRDGNFDWISSNDLVPGDIVNVQQDTILPCDMALLVGQVICNESMLTGESVPVTKHPLFTREQIAQRSDDSIVDINQARSSLFGGTLPVKTIPHSQSGRVLAMVREIGFQTSKGKLILSILFPKKSHFRFTQESFKFIGVLCCIALVGFSLTVWRLKALGEDSKTIVLRAMDLITIVIPPALPLAMSVGTGFALVRLKKRGIFCISPPRLNMAGKIQVFCFDKTGTITEDGLDFYGVLAPSREQSDRNKFGEFITSSSMASFNDRIFKMIMASCHSLSTINNMVSGDPLELKIFQATAADLNEETASNTSISYAGTELLDSEHIEYVERFDFQSSLQRMSVIVTTSQGEHYSFVKGAPEMIKKLALASSLPADYDHRLHEYTERGYRVLACAYKQWEHGVSASTNRDLMRQMAEDQLIFVGFIVMENKMKPESKGIIATLQRANIKTIMVTGDNPLTAVSVSRQSGILHEDAILFTPEMSDRECLDTMVWRNISASEQDRRYQLDPYTLQLEGDDDRRPQSYSLVITGTFFKRLHNTYLQTGSLKFLQMLRRGMVYARMSPDDKQTLVEELQRIGLYVGMCGDGANDCGALKSAHVGISLSETEASIAAPFTSTINNISCCPTLIKEGRASLAVSFKLFQFMGMYSLIQFTTVIFLYFKGSVLGNWMYLYQDLWVIFPLVIFMGMTQPSDTLSVKRPSGRLISGAVVGSLIVHILLCLAFQAMIFLTVQHQPWYNEQRIDPQNIVTYVTTSLFTYGNFQYLIIALALSFGKPFLKPLYTNRLLFIVYLVTLGTSLLILFAPSERVWKVAQLLVLPVSWRFVMIGSIIANLCVNLIAEFGFYYYKQRSKKRKQTHYDQIFTKEAPKDLRIAEEAIRLLPMNK